jgi:peroxiredoxin
MTSPIKLIVVLAALAVMAVGAFVAALSMPVPSAPEARFSTLSGESFVTSELRGKVAVVNFWATNCAPCLAEMPKLSETYRKFAPQGLEVIAVALHHDRPNRVADYARREALPFKVALDANRKIASAFGNVHITPTTFLIDKRGRIIRRIQGEPDWRQFHVLVDKALAEKI